MGGEQTGASIVSLWLIGALVVGLIGFLVLFHWWDVPGWLKRKLHIRTQVMGIVVVVIGAILLSVIVTLLSMLLTLDIHVMEALLGLALGFDFALIPSMIRQNGSKSGSAKGGRTSPQKNTQRRQPPSRQGRRSRG